LGELMEAARMVTGQPLPAGGRLAVLGNAGGVNMLATDAAQAAGLVVPEPYPVDLGTTASPVAFAKALDGAASGGQVDAVLVVAAASRVTDIAATLEALAAEVDRWDELPVAIVVLGAPDAPTTVGSRRVPVYELPEQAVRAIGRAAGYAAWLREPLGARPVLSDIDAVAAREAVEGAEGWQPYGNVARILSAYGIPLAPAATASAEAGAIRLTAGVVHDKLFGSLVTLGVGGVHTDLLDDRALRLVPLTDLDAGRMWRSLRAARLLTGDRGSAPVDTAALEDLLLRLGRLAEDLPEVAELDLNPVLIGPHGLAVAGAKLRLAPVGPEPDPALRRLR
jgi:acyl-CoA synthetase (NDP forming)